jgi:hypothetical protein
MLSTTAGKRDSLAKDGQSTRKTSGVMFRKIWLPKLLYGVLPYFYLVAGFLAFLATLYISEWFWVLPHYLLFSVVCVHLGVLVFRRRRRAGEA